MEGITVVALWYMVVCLGIFTVGAVVGVVYLLREDEVEAGNRVVVLNGTIREGVMPEHYPLSSSTSSSSTKTSSEIVTEIVTEIVEAKTISSAEGSKFKVKLVEVNGFQIVTRLDKQLLRRVRFKKVLEEIV